MQGDVLTDEEAASRLVQLISKKWYILVDTGIEMFYTSQPDRPISCVIAASVHMKGFVNVVGGYGTNKVRVQYNTENGKPDVLFVLVQTTKSEPVHVEGDVAWNARSGIAYEPMRNWTLTEIQDALRNVTSQFSSS